MDVAVLLIVFNRPETAARVLARILEARPRDLYIAADGPRPSVPSDIEKCKKTRSLFSDIPSSTRTHTLFQSNNLGCRSGPSTALTWFFSHVERGIIVEDDCLPDLSFFSFCEKGLQRFENDHVIKLISGQNPLGKFKTDSDVIFSKYAFIWGWASWSRAWKDVDLELRDWPSKTVADDIRKWLSSKHAIWHWFQNFNSIKEGLDAWDFQFNFMLYRQRGLAAISATNLVRNIGFNSDATHTSDQNDTRQFLPVISAPDQLKFPEAIQPNKQFDRKLVRLNYYCADLTFFGKAKRLLRFFVRCFKTGRQTQ